MLEVRLAPGFAPEQRYIIAVLLDEFLGVAHFIADEANERPVVSISAEGKTLALTQTLFRGEEDRLRSAYSAPSRPLLQISPAEEGLDRERFCGGQLPVIYGTPDPQGRWISRERNRVRLDLDVLGSAFFMLTRLEETLKTERDAHARFPASASLAAREGFLDRPVVNEYAEILWQLLAELWPVLTRRRRSFQVAPTHDVDEPFAYRPLKLGSWSRTVAGDFLKRRDPRKALARMLNGGLALARLPHADPLDTFDWLMGRSESAGSSSEFYFMAGSGGAYDGRYALGMKPVRELVRRIAQRGHAIGLHPSYHTFRDGARLSNEASALEQLLEEEGVEHDGIGGRQHYLRWEAPTTWQLYEDCGLKHDSSLCYADRCGFRCGVCYDYPAFNVVTRRQLKLVERPLLIMESSLFHERYMNLDHEAARECVGRIRERVEKYGGTFRILWHNSWFARSDRERPFYDWTIRMPEPDTAGLRGSRTAGARELGPSCGVLKAD